MWSPSDARIAGPWLEALELISSPGLGSGEVSGTVAVPPASASVSMGEAEGSNPATLSPVFPASMAPRSVAAVLDELRSDGIVMDILPLRRRRPGIASLKAGPADVTVEGLPAAGLVELAAISLRL